MMTLLGILKTYGIRLGSVGPVKLHQEVKFRIHELNPLVRQTIEGMLELFDELNQKISQIDKKLLKIS